MGALLIAAGLYAFLEKWEASGIIKVESVYDVILNIALFLVIIGGIIFIVSFAGCVGALRENTCLLKFVSFSPFLGFCSYEKPLLRRHFESNHPCLLSVTSHNFQTLLVLGKNLKFTCVVGLS